jgi:hypothetical protein
LSGATNATINAAQTAATTTITETDVATVTVNDVTVNEAAGTMTFTVSLDNAVAGGFAIDVVFNNATATGGAAIGATVDYVDTIQTLNFAGTAGETRTVTVAINDDLVTEANETFTVSLANLVPASAPLASFAITDTGTGTITDNDAPPALRNNAWTIADGGTLSVTLVNVSASDPDTPLGSLVFTVAGVTHGYFEFVSNPGVAVTGFTQQQVANGEVRFVHDASGAAPTFTLLVSDGTTGVGPYIANITFTVGGFIAPPPAGGGGGGSGGGGPVITPPPLSPSTTPATSPGVAGAASFFRTPTEPQAGGGEDGVEEPPVVRPSAAATTTVEKQFAAEMALPPLRVEPEAIETKPLRSEVEVEPVRAEMQVIPTRHNLDLDEEERGRIDIVVNSIKITGLAFSVGAVWWAARAAGLVASLLASSPAWRHVDPLPVLGRDDEDEEEVDVVEEDKERKDDEHRAAWVLEDRAG